jgi:hypothetical protein
LALLSVKPCSYAETKILHGVGNQVDFVFAVASFFGLLVWLWFALTLNGLYNQLKRLNEKVAKQTEFLEYMISSDVFDRQGKSNEAH